MKNRILVCLQILAAVLLFGSCSSQSRNEDTKKWMSSSGKIKVLSTIAMIEDLVKQVGGDHVITLTLVKGDLDPHSYQLVKGDDEKLASADVIFYNGLGLEHGPSLRNYLETNSKAIGLGDLVRKENPGLILSYNGSMDPHIWTDIQLWNRTVKFITETLETYDPTHASVYKENGQKLEKAMEALHFKLKNEMKEVPPEKRYLITSHDAFNYFARAYLASEGEIETGDWQNRFAAPEGLAPESQLSTTDIRLILDHMKKYDIHVIFPESNVSQASIRKLLSAGLEQGIRITISPEFLYGDAMGAPGSNGDSYFKMIKHNIRTIAKYLKDDDRSQK